MRTSTAVRAVVAAGAAACAASPALAQARILVVQDQTQPAQTSPAAPALEQAPPPSSQTLAPPPVAPKAEPSPPPAQAQAPASAPAEAEKATQSESPAKRQDRAMQAPPPPRLPFLPGRFIFRRVDNGFLRLDRQSGQVTYCSSRDDGWSCAAVPEKSASLQKQIDQLRGEVAAVKSEIAALKHKIATLRAPPHPEPPQTVPHPVPPQTVPPSPTPLGDHTGGLKLPSHEDIARARGFIADTWHRLVEMIENMQKDLLHKNGDGGNGVSRT